MVTVELPCKVGDFVWGVGKNCGKRYILCGEVAEIYFADETMTPAIRIKGVCCGRWGVNVFATKQEALDEIERWNRRKHEQEKLNP
jgi:hypothetical protein